MDRAQYVARCAELLRLPLQADSRPPRLRLIPLVDAEQAMALREAAEHYADAARELRLRTVLHVLGVPTRARCIGCGHPQPFTGLTGYGRCVACSLKQAGPRDPTLERLTHDTEPVLSSERDTRDTDRPLAPHVDWAKP